MAQLFLLGTPRDEYSLRLSPHSANIDRAKFEQQCGGILAHTQRVCARGMTISKRNQQWNFSQFSRALQTVELRRDFFGLRHRIGTERRGARERRGSIGK